MGTALGARGQRRKKLGAKGGVREPESDPSLGQEEVHSCPDPWHGERADARGLAEPPFREERLRHC